LGDEGKDDGYLMLDEGFVFGSLSEVGSQVHLADEVEEEGDERNGGRLILRRGNE